MNRKTWTVLLGLCIAAGLSAALVACNGDGENRGGSDSDSDGDSDGDTDTGPDECADYRTTYPAAPYGTTVDAVMADVPDLIDGDSNPHDLFEIFQNTGVVALAIANAFDT